MSDTPAPSGPRLIAIAAMARNRVIGRDGRLPWHLPEDLAFFKRTTQGFPVLMGRTTYESILAALGRPLPGRRNIVLSSQMPQTAGIEVVPSLEKALQLPDLPEKVYLIGGAQVYQAALPACAEVILTVLEKDYEGDACFPPFEDDFTLAEILGQGDGLEFRRYVRRA